MQVLRRFSPVFEQVSAGLSMVKNVIDVIKTTTKTNMRELNKRIMGLLNIDEGFKQAMLELNP